MKNKLSLLIIAFSLFTGYTLSLNAVALGEKPGSGMESPIDQLAAYVKWSEKNENIKGNQDKINKIDKIRVAAENAKKEILDGLDRVKQNNLDQALKIQLQAIRATLENPGNNVLISGQMANQETVNKIKWDQQGGEQVVLDHILKLEDQIKKRILIALDKSQNESTNAN